jgi:hypothetical protein
MGLGVLSMGAISMFARCSAVTISGKPRNHTLMKRLRTFFVRV